MSKYTCFMGIDPGREGAFGVLSTNDGELWEPDVWDMSPTTNRGIDLIWANDLLSRFMTSGVLVILESNTARPGEVPDYAMRFGWQTGNLEALLYAKGFETRLVPPNLWTGRLGLPGKTHHGSIEQRAAMWDELYPEHKEMVRGPKGGLKDGRLDALLMAEWLRMTELSPVGTKGGKRPPKFFGYKP
jgi:hypothetical protein